MKTRNIVLALVALMTASAWAQQPCEKLAGLKLPHTTITSAAPLPAGNIPPAPFTPNAPPIPVPSRCVVKGVARPTSDSEIKFEVWLPSSGWNGKYQQVGNGGWSGSIPVQALAFAIKRGYATAGTDDGHSGSPIEAGWAVGHPEKLADFGYRALHETTLQAKAIVGAFYGAAPSRNYFVGCSNGGREALMEAQRFPEEFDGIIAGAPAGDWSHLAAGFIWNEQALMNDPSSAIPPAKLRAVQAAVMKTCDAHDGVKDGLLEDPRTCNFDPAVLTCKGNDAPDCLTAPQVAALRKIYSGPVNARTGKKIFPGYPVGVEATWAPWIVALQPAGALQFAFGNSYFADAVFENPKWDFHKMNFDTDTAVSDEKAGSVLNAVNPDLRSFRAHGGKLIQYHGWGDPAIPAVSSIEYYEKVRSFSAHYPDPRSTSPGPVEDFYRLFLVPGMAHCSGGAGPSDFGNWGNGTKDPESDILSALERWVENGVAPQHIIGKGEGKAAGLTRPLCPYPQTAHYKGQGSPNDAANFTCAAP